MSPKSPWKIRDKITAVNTALLDAMEIEEHLFIQDVKN